jgi:predicted thioredoxin/glutaredoxin
VAPVPSLFIDGELVFDAILPMFELEEAILEALEKRGIDT